MSKVGYARVSTHDQSLTLQLEALKQAGCIKIFSDTASGSDANRRGFLDLKYYLRSGDTLVVTRIDRIARSVLDLQQLVAYLKEQEIELTATEQPISTSSAAGKAFLDMLGVFAEFELNIRKERQLEGIAAAKAAGKYKGRKPIPVDTQQEILAMHREHNPVSEIARLCKVSRNTVYKIIREQP
ncbi:recombinase family protein [Vibrio sp. SM6]|uniref:Recombinase family protein n=1 Tax=Vibrio agarilyticus TaxID=2726741 RepID=A0A7X8YIR6_9VIBR|nr:recombinase family protein [Vibrio agarilyticus]NLS14905.1 recombinase family protein [Vibrio agarilyticus]